MNYHQHLLIDAIIDNPINDVEEAKEWLQNLVKSVDMEVFGGPWAQYCDDPCNEGLSGLIWLTTSHASFHIWNQNQPFIKFDLYSCKPFTKEPVLELFKHFQPKTLNFTMIDRTSGDQVVTDKGSINFED